jgi:hypothetical protein
VCTTNLGQHTPRLLTPTRTPKPACTTPSPAKPEHADLIDRDHTGTILKRYHYQPRAARKTTISAPLNHPVKRSDVPFEHDHGMSANASLHP